MMDRHFRFLCRHFYYLLLFCLLTLTTVSHASDLDYVVRKYSLPKEHNNSEILDLVRDRYGFIFVATGSGLLEWDGNSFKTYNSVNTKDFSLDRIHNLYLTSTNDLWLIRRNYHLTRKRDGVFETFSVPENSGTIRKFVFDDVDNLWVLTDGIVYRFNDENEVFDSFSGFDELDKTHIIGWHNSGFMFFLNESGVWKYSSGMLVKVLSTNNLAVEPESILSLYFTESNKLYIGHRNGFISYDLKSQKTITNHLHNGMRVFRFVEDRDRTFIGFSNVGSLHFRNDSNQFNFKPLNDSKNLFLNLEMNSIDDIMLSFRESQAGTLNSMGGNRILIHQQMVIEDFDQPRFIYDDGNNTLWIGTTNGIIYQIRTKSVDNLMSTPVGDIRNVYSIIQNEDSSIWYACMINGIFMERNGTYLNWNISNSNIPANDVRYLFYHPVEKVVYASIYHDGLWQFKNNKWEEIEEVNSLLPKYATVIEAMYYDHSKNRILSGSLQHMLVQDADGWKNFKPDGSDSPTHVRVIRPTRSGELLLGTGGSGILLMDSNDTIRWNIQVRDGLASNSIRDIYVQSDDTLWVATENNGINRLILDTNRKVAQYKHIGVEAGLTNQRIHRIIDDNTGRLWISTNYGIMVARIKQLNDYLDGKFDYLPLYYMDEYSGMLSPEANGGVDNAGLLLNDGNIVFPTQKGVIFIDPTKISNRNDGDTPSPIIREIKSFSKLFNTLQINKIKLPLGEREFTVFFQAPLFNDPNYRLIRYKLSEIDSDWNILKDNFTVWYSRLKPGSYTLTLQIITFYGAPVERELALIVPPYLYERPLIQILAGISGILIVVFGTRFGYGKTLEMNEIRRMVDAQTNELRKVNEDKSQFFASITHELRTPVAIIMDNIDLLLLDSNDSMINQSTKKLKRIQRNSYKLLVLIDTLLEIAKLQNDRIKLNITPINILHSTQLILDDLSDLLTEKKLHINWIIGQDLDYLSVNMDIQAWERIIVNIVNNAITFSPENGTIYIEFIKDNELIIEITDEGIGVSDDELDVVFDFLKQGKTQNNSTGSGLGLFLVKELIIRHNGVITVYNKKDINKGACFRITLPYTESPQFLPKPDRSDTIIPDYEGVDTEEIDYAKRVFHNFQNPLQKQKVLVIEDNTDYREFLASELSGSYQITALNSANKALELIKNIQPDLVISDIIMPELSGFQLVQTIRQIEEFRTLPVIFLSALDSEMDTHTGLSAGADVYLTKPIKPQILKAQIQALLRREMRFINYTNQFKNSDSEVVSKIKEIIYRHLGNNKLSVEMISESLFISRSNLYRKWGEENEISIQQYIVQTRLKEGLYLIKDKKFSITEAAYAVGFSDSRYFSTVFRKQYGYSPSKLYA
jgi:signal transduction histidine kinase/AraC-like DNA-binding protein/ligand-binding sensor domain-containing protein